MTEKATSLARSLTDSDSQALYDEHAKRLLGYRWILAAFLKQVMPQTGQYSVPQIVSMIEPDIQISTNRLHPDLKIRGLNQEYREKLKRRKAENRPGNEETEDCESKGIRFDILFRIQLASGICQVLINIEIQKKRPAHYHLFNRIVAYIGELIASQTDREYVKGDYDSLMPVCSIWIAAGQKKNTVTVYNLEEHTDGERGMWGDPDKIRAVVLGFNEESVPVADEHPVWNLLRSLFSTTMEVEERLEILEQYQIPVTADVEEEVLTMCNLGEGVYEKGRLQGEKDSLNRISRLIKAMTQAGRLQEFQDSIDDESRLTALFAEFEIH